MTCSLMAWVGTDGSGESWQGPLSAERFDRFIRVDPAVPIGVLPHVDNDRQQRRRCHARIGCHSDATHRTRHIGRDSSHATHRTRHIARGTSLTASAADRSTGETFNCPLHRDRVIVPFRPRSLLPVGLK